MKSDSEKFTVTLPNNAKLHFARTGQKVKVRDVPDGQCFLHEGQVWEKLPQSCGNLSDFNDDSWVLEFVTVERLRQQT